MSTTPINGGHPTATATHPDNLRERIESVLAEMKTQHTTAKRLAEDESNPLKRSRLNSQAFAMRKFTEKLERALDGNAARNQTTK